MSDLRENITPESNGTESPSNSLRLGVRLKEERERHGLSYDQIAQITKLRRHILVALENEIWHELPPPVFVRGFIRSYAKALSLDEDEILGLYEHTCPVKAKIPMPLLEPHKESRKPQVLVLILILVISAGIYFWTVQPFWETGQSISLEGNEKTSFKLKVPPRKGKTPPAQSQGAKPALKETEKSFAPSGNAHVPDRAAYMQDIFSGDESDDLPLQMGTPISSTTESETTDKWLTLQAFVKHKTWLQISVDRGEPKEYIFHPGSSPQWQAKEGFNILVGNAAGIEFDYNGKRIDNLGKLGQVIRLILPDDYQPTEHQNQ